MNRTVDEEIDYGLAPLLSEDVLQALAQLTDQSIATESALLAEAILKMILTELE